MSMYIKNLVKDILLLNKKRYGHVKVREGELGLLEYYTVARPGAGRACSFKAVAKELIFILGE